MIDLFKIEQKLGLRFYQGGASGSSGSTTPQATPQQMMEMYSKYLPSALGTATAGSIPANTGLAVSAANANPIYTASGLSQLDQYGSGYQKIGSDLASQQAISQASQVAGPGGLTAALGAQLSNYLNPAQAASNTQATNLVNSINLNGLSGGETAAVDRSLNQSNYATGNLGLDNATNAVSNAMNFGNALQAKRNALGSALQSAGGVASNQNAFTNPVQTALNAGNTSNNFGLNQYNPTQANANITAPYSFASSFGNQLAGISAASKGTSGSSSANGGISCYLTTACCDYKGLPDNCEQLTVLRNFRDKYVPVELVKEYYRVAPSIVLRLTNEQLDYVWRVVNACVSAIKKGHQNIALYMYNNMVKELA